MKKVHFLSAALMALALTACNDEPIDKAQSNPIGETGGKYIAINLRNADAGSRALDQIQFIEGTPDENAISDGQLHFFFFDINGEPFSMTGNHISGSVMKDDLDNATNWVKPVVLDKDGNPVDIDPDHVNTGIPTPSSNGAVLILGDSEGFYEGKIPSRIICVANITDDEARLMYANKSIKQLLKDYRTDASSAAPLHKKLTNDEGRFIMTSSTYYADGQIICWSDIKAEMIKGKAEEAKKNPVNIYIERLASKVSVKSYPANPVVHTNTGEDMEITYSYIDPADNTIKESTAKNIIMEPVGWNVNTCSRQVFGIKHLFNETEPGSGILVSDYFDYKQDPSSFNLGYRSFWATTSSINAVSNFIPSKLEKTEGQEIYVMPNTRDPFLQGNGKSGVDRLRGQENFARCFATKILFAAKIHIIDPGTPYEQAIAAEPDKLMYWGGSYYTPEALCLILERNVGKKIAYSRIMEPDDEDGHYKVEFYALGPGSLDKAGQDLTDPTTGMVAEDIDAEVISNVPAAQYWNGMAYYIINISNNLRAPLQDGKNMYGLVRNTAYVYDLIEYIGLGTPVPAPTAETKVENPTESDAFIAAKLNILNWRLVAYDHTTLK